MGSAAGKSLPEVTLVLMSVVGTLDLVVQPFLRTP